MAQVVGLESLPLEPVEVIVTYLSATDLTRCLAVNRTWYNIFSNDVFWKKHCTVMVTPTDYFIRTKCLVEPEFKLPTGIQDHQKYRLQFLQEQHLWKNWDSGHYKMEEIEFDRDNLTNDDIDNIIASFLDNDHVCLHKSNETQVWNVIEFPFLVMTVPHCLNIEMESCHCVVFNEILVVIQCNVVSVYQISLGSKSWCRTQVFFFNRPEEFSSIITSETDINSLFNSQPKVFCKKIEYIICGEYFVGAYNGEESPILHVWNIKKGKKIKEQKFEHCKGKYFIKLEEGYRSIRTNQVLITFEFLGNVTSIPGEDHLMAGSCGRNRCSVVYDLLRLQLILPTRCYHSGDVYYFDGELFVVEEHSLKIKILRDYKGPNEYEIVSRKRETYKYVICVEPLGADNLVIATNKEVFLVNASDITVQLKALSILKVDYYLYRMDVLFEKYVLMYSRDWESLKEIWKLGVENDLKKVMEFPPNSSYYDFVASNSAGSRVVLKNGNKLIVWNFW